MILAMNRIGQGEQLSSQQLYYRKLHKMKQGIEINFKKDLKVQVFQPQTRLSMTSRDHNLRALKQPNIENVLALQLSETLMNAAYSLSVTTVTVGIKRLCDPLEKQFFKLKCFALQNIIIYSNRSHIHAESYLQGPLKTGTLYPKSQTGQIQLLQQSKTGVNNQVDRIMLTQQQQEQKVYDEIIHKLNRSIKILSVKVTKTKYMTLLIIQSFKRTDQCVIKQNKSEIQQIFERYEQSRTKSRRFHRRSIDKQPVKKSFNQASFSLNKNKNKLLLNRIVSPNRNVQHGKNILYPYGKNGSIFRTDKKASTCSHTHSCNSRNQHFQSPSKRQYYVGSKNTSTNNPLSKLHTSSVLQSKSSRIHTQQSKMTCTLLNGSYFAEGTKQRQLQLLRNKYYRLVDEFKLFNQRFLQVIKQE